MDRYVSPEPIPLPDFTDDFELLRADLVFTGVDHSGPSYEGRVFINNPEADLETPRDADNGYAGSFFVFGHGACYGEEGHCDTDQGFHDAFDIRPPHPLAPLTKTVIVTEPLRKVEAVELRVTVVGVDHSTEEANSTDALHFDEVRLLVYDD